MFKHALLAAVAASIFLTGCSTMCTTVCKTKQPAPTPAQRFAKADTDNNGRVTRDQFIDLMIEKAFTLYDKNGNGYVTEAEYVAGGGTAAAFRKINTSGTGKATLAEAKASKMIRDTMVVPFDEADVNNNGSVTLAEYEAYLVKRDAAVR